MDAKLAQRESALANANLVKGQRSQLRKELHASKPASRRRAVELLGDLPDWLSTCSVEKFLTYFPGIGRVRAKLIASKMRLDLATSLDRLSSERRSELARWIAQTGAP